MLQSQPLKAGSARIKVTFANLLPPLWVFICYVGFSSNGCWVLFLQTVTHSEQRPNKSHLTRSCLKLFYHPCSMFVAATLAIIYGVLFKPSWVFLIILSYCSSLFSQIVCELKPGSWVWSCHCYPKWWVTSFMITGAALQKKVREFRSDL